MIEIEKKFQGKSLTSFYQISSGHWSLVLSLESRLISTSQYKIQNIIYNIILYIYRLGGFSRSTTTVKLCSLQQANPSEEISFYF